MDFEEDRKSYSSGAPEHRSGIANGFRSRTVNQEGGDAVALMSDLIDGLAKSQSSHDHTSHEDSAYSRVQNALAMNSNDVTMNYDYENLEHLQSIDRNSISIQQHQTTHTAHIEYFKAVTQEVTPEIIERSWDDFMNKNIEDDHEYSIEVLVGDAYIPELAVEQTRKDADPKLHGKMIPGIKTKPRTELPNVPFKASQEASKPVPEQIRINSTEILCELNAIDKSFDASTPLVMRRPFKFLVCHAHRIEHIIKNLQRRLSYLEQGGQETSEARKTLQHMSLLPEFLGRYVYPTRSALKLDTTSKIEFSNLWYIFPPGETVFLPMRVAEKFVDPADMGTTLGAFQTRYEMLWRVTACSGGRTNISTPFRKTTPRPNDFSINCYYIDYDGKSFCPIIHTFTIAPFEGERTITELELFPVRFLKDAAETARQHGLHGKAIYESIARSYSHSYYIGPTILVQPCGCPLPRDGDLHQEYIESEVIVDFKTAYLNHPSWRPRPNYWKRPVVYEHETRSMWPVHCWEDGSRGKLHSAQPDHVYDDYIIDVESAIDFRDSQIIFKPVPTGWVASGVDIPDEDLAILTSRAFAFILRTRTWAGIWFWTLQPIKPQKESLNNLRLRDESVKTTIQALVNSHFSSAASNNSFEYDVVRGKGKGLIILLHGAPGVGKTSTAESVAAAGGRPLFRITCGDLGLTPIEVEKALKEIFRYASLWNGVLLLDECDVFLAQRKKNDIKRNALVSIFLRTLEFYTGVLILATNRVGVLDDAVKSRLTWTAYYPPLSKIQTKEIWDVNIRLLKLKNDAVDIDVDGVRRFAKHHYKVSAGQNCAWNGRQIQNAFKVATALAEWEKIDQMQAEHGTGERVPSGLPPDDQAKPVVTAKHFEVIAKGTKAFDDYLLETQGRSEAERAWDEMERADDYSPDESDHSIPELSPLDRRSTRSPKMTFQDAPRRSSTTVLGVSMDQQHPGYRNGQANSQNPEFSRSRRRSSTKNLYLPSQLDQADPSPGTSHRHRRQSSHQYQPSPSILATVPDIPRAIPPNGYVHRRGSRNDPPNDLYDARLMSHTDGHDDYLASSPHSQYLNNDPAAVDAPSESDW